MLNVQIAVLREDGDFECIFDTQLPCLPNIGDLIDTSLFEDENHPTHDLDALIVKQVSFRPPSSKITIICDETR